MVIITRRLAAGTSSSINTKARQGEERTGKSCPSYMPAPLSLPNTWKHTSELTVSFQFLSRKYLACYGFLVHIFFLPRRKPSPTLILPSALPFPCPSPPALPPRKVCLCGFRQLKDQDVQLLLDSCPALSVLSVADCTTLGSLVLSSRQLRSLDVSRCIHISEMSLDTPGEMRKNDKTTRRQERRREGGWWGAKFKPELIAGGLLSVSARASSPRPRAFFHQRVERISKVFGYWRVSFPGVSKKRRTSPRPCRFWPEPATFEKEERPAAPPPPALCFSSVPPFPGLNESTPPGRSPKIYRQAPADVAAAFLDPLFCFCFVSRLIDRLTCCSAAKQRWGARE